MPETEALIEMLDIQVTVALQDSSVPIVSHEAWVVRIPPVRVRLSPS